MAERSFSGQVDGVVTFKNWLVIESSRVRFQQPQKLFLEKLPFSAHTKKNRGHKSSLACFKRSDEAKSWHTRTVVDCVLGKALLNILIAVQYVLLRSKKE